MEITWGKVKGLSYAALILVSTIAYAAPKAPAPTPTPKKHFRPVIPACVLKGFGKPINKQCK